MSSPHGTENAHMDKTYVASSPGMRQLLNLAGRAARSEATVLITGESGTGKERLARYVHDLSPRSRGPFVAINCGALPENLLESELFGHAKGAFTGAVTARKGLFETARTGTLFLDEIGETSLTMQVRLLRALQERTIRPVGGDKEIATDVRIVAATNRDLIAMVDANSFRKDLFYRLRVVPLELPPLRARTEDIAALSKLFIGQVCGANHCGPCSLSADVLKVLHSYPWPGNIRELENAIERAVVLAEGHPLIRVADLPPEVRNVAWQSELSPGQETRELTHELLTLDEVERRHILATLAYFDGHRRKTAESLDIGTNTLWRRLKKWGVVA